MNQTVPAPASLPEWIRTTTARPKARSPAVAMERVTALGLAASSARIRSARTPRAQGPITWRPPPATGAVLARSSPRCRAGSTRAAPRVARPPAPRTPTVPRKPTARPTFARTRRPTARLAPATARAAPARASTACAARTAARAPAKLVHKPKPDKIRDAAYRCRPRKIPTTSARSSRATAVARTVRATAVGSVACGPSGRLAEPQRAAGER